MTLVLTGRSLGLLLDRFQVFKHRYASETEMEHFCLVSDFLP